MPLWFPAGDLYLHMLNDSNSHVKEVDASIQEQWQARKGHVIN